MNACLATRSRAARGARHDLAARARSPDRAARRRGHPRPARARRDAPAAAPSVHRRGTGVARLRRHRAADRAGPDDLAAVGRRAHDRGADRGAACRGACSKSAPARATSARCWPQLVEQVYTVERIDELLRNARRRFRKLGDRQRALAARRRPPRLAGGGAVRCDHPDRRGHGAGEWPCSTSSRRTAAWSRRSARPGGRPCCACAPVRTAGCANRSARSVSCRCSEASG